MSTFASDEGLDLRSPESRADLLIFGYAVVSANGRIADHRGRFPESLRFDADRALFQDALDAADLTVLGRRTHEAAPNVKGRRRLVLSRHAHGVYERDSNTIWCNPEEIDLGEVLRSLALERGRVAVAGGTGVYDLVGRVVGYDAFSLSVAERVELPGGRFLFRGCNTLRDVGRRLEGFGLVADARTWLDRKAGLRLYRYRKQI